MLDASSRCRRRSRSRGSSGSPRGRPRRGRRASPARGSPCGGRPRGGPRAGSRPRCGGGGRTSRATRPWLAMASTQRSRSKFSLHSWNVPPAAPDVLDDRAEAAIAAADEALDRWVALGSCHLMLHALGAAGVVAQQVDLALQLLDGVLPEPLERGERLGHEPADRHGDRRALGVVLAELDAVAGQLGDAEGVLVGLGGQPGEEVELHPPPALASRRRRPRRRGLPRG